MNSDHEILKEMGAKTNKAFNCSFIVAVTESEKDIEISFSPKNVSKILISAISVTPSMPTLNIIILRIILSIFSMYYRQFNLINDIDFTVEIEKKGSSKKNTIIGVSVGVSIFILLCIVGYCLWVLKKKSQNLYKDEGNSI